LLMLHASAGSWCSVWFQSTWFRQAQLRVSAWTLVIHASVRRSMGVPAQPAVPADRCAREIVGF